MKNTQDFFPDGTPVAEWFHDTTIPTLADLGKQYPITAYGALDDGRIHTKEIQACIDAAAKTGGVVVVPAGVYYTGAIYFKPGVNLYLAQGATLKGSDDIADYDLTMTRMEGETCPYFGALINGDGLDGFTILGPAPSTATVCARGGHSGCGASGTACVPIRTSSARAWSTSPTAKTCCLPMSRCKIPTTGRPICIAATM